MISDEAVTRGEINHRPSLPVMIAVFVIFTFVFHFAWEILQVSLFARMPVISHWQATLVCLKATLGDIVIALASFAAAAVWQKDWHWFARPNWVRSRLTLRLAS